MAKVDVYVQPNIEITTSEAKISCGSSFLHLNGLFVGGFDLRFTLQNTGPSTSMGVEQLEMKFFDANQSHFNIVEERKGGWNYNFVIAASKPIDTEFDVEYAYGIFHGNANFNYAVRFATGGPVSAITFFFW